MSRKIFISVVAGLVCITSWKTIIQPARERASISRVLTLNNQFAKEMKWSWEDFFTFEIGRIPTEYVDKLRSVNLEGCPSDFREAFLNYIAAVDSYADACRESSGLKPIKNIIIGKPQKSIYETMEEGKVAERRLLDAAQRHNAKAP